MERRKLLRIDRNIPVDLDVGGRRVRSTTVNLSPGGLSLRMRMDARPGTRLRGRLETLGGTALEFEAEVRWTRADEDEPEHSTVGVEFLGPPAEHYFEFLRRVWDEQSGARESVAPPRKTRATPAGTRAAVRKTPSTGKRVSPLRLVKPGIDGLAEVMAGSARWTSWADPVEPSLSTAAATALIERAASRALATVLPAGVRTVGRQTEVSVTSVVPVSSGATVVARATLMEVSADRKTLTFEATVREGSRTLARGRHVRTIVRA